jgi:peptidoglycan/LPS O-acetylase OafA/YrhL
VTAPPVSVSRRVEWLDGVRGLAATYVLLHHVWLNSFLGFPSDTGPWFLGWLLYGHLAVVVFIVVSGYSLTLAPKRNGFRLKGGAKEFARRRAWRILPPYWAALAISVFLVNVLIAPRVGGGVDLRSVLIHALLLQDLVGNTPPNGTFWSIAIEAQIYVLFPLLLLMWRRLRPIWTVTVVTGVVVGLYVTSLVVPEIDPVNNLTPQLLVAFVFGMLAANRAELPRMLGRSVPLLAIATAGGVILVMAAVLAGPEWIVARYFWVDLLVAGLAAAAFRWFSARGGAVARGLASRVPAGLGRFSYSSYLIHSPVIVVVVVYITQPMGLDPGETFLALLLIAVPLALAVSYGFFLVFERPFLVARSWASLTDEVRAARRRRVGRAHSVEPATDPSPTPEGSRDLIG